MSDIDELTDKIFNDVGEALGGPGSLNGAVRAAIWGNLVAADIPAMPDKREQEIDDGLHQLISAFKAGKEDESGLTLMVLVGGFFKDVARIANALEASATYQAVDLGNRYGVEEGDYGVEMQPEPEVERPWMEWDGRDHNGPPVEPWALVDVRYRQPSKGDRVPDETGISPLKVQWLHHGRPTNADIVGWRLSKDQPGAPTEVEGPMFADPSTTDTYNGAWIEYTPSTSYQPVGNRLVDAKLRDGSELRSVNAQNLSWHHNPLGLGGSDSLDIVAWRPVWRDGKRIN